MQPQKIQADSNGSEGMKSVEKSISKSGGPVKGRRTAMMRVKDGTSEPLMRGGLKRGGKQEAVELSEDDQVTNEIG